MVKAWRCIRVSRLRELSGGGAVFACVGFSNQKLGEYKVLYYYED